MKRYIWVVPVVALAAVVLFTASRRFAAGSELNGVKPDVDITLSNYTRGQTWYTAAINPDATVANCFQCNKANTVHVTTGSYQVGFNTNVTANNGWSRWVQVDTLTTGTITNVSCTTADRAGLVTAVWVQCFNNSTGALQDTSFFLFVAR